MNDKERRKGWDLLLKSADAGFSTNEFDIFDYEETPARVEDGTFIEWSQKISGERYSLDIDTILNEMKPALLNDKKFILKAIEIVGGHKIIEYVSGPLLNDRDVMRKAISIINGLELFIDHCVFEKASAQLRSDVAFITEVILENDDNLEILEVLEEDVIKKVLFELICKEARFIKYAPDDLFNDKALMEKAIKLNPDIKNHL